MGVTREVRNPYKRTIPQKIRFRLRHYRQKAMEPVKWLAYTTHQTRLVPPPDHMYIESTNLCNLSCIMCPTGQKLITRPKGFMDFDLFKRIVDEMAPHVRRTTLHIWGEPLLHKRIFDMIAYAHEKGLQTEISSNATLLDEEKAYKLIESGLDVIYLAMDGLRPETYESVRVNADFERTNNNIRRFLQIKEEMGFRRPFVKIQIIQMKQTLEEIEEFVRQWKIPGVDWINVKAFDSWGGQVESINELKAGESAPQIERYPCPNLWYHVHIYWDGSLAMCDRDFNLDFPLGNVKDGVMKAWNGPRMQELRRRHIEGRLDDVSPCNTCTEWAWWKPTLFSSQGNKLVNPNGEEDDNGERNYKVSEEEEP